MTATLALLLMVMPAIVLLVACLNLADLLLARGQARRQDLFLPGRRRRLKACQLIDDLAERGLAIRLRIGRNALPLE